jgi:hypothetical protein
MTEYVERVEVASDGAEAAQWADQTRRVLTRDLLVRATQVDPAGARALEFRALHLNLSLVGEVADRLRLTDRQRARCESAGLEGLHEALGSYDPFGPTDFAEHAAPHVERHMVERQRLPRLAHGAARRRRDQIAVRHPVRLAVRRMAVVIAGARTPG